MANDLAPQEIFEWYHRQKHHRIGQQLYAVSDAAARAELARVGTLLDEVVIDDADIAYAPTAWHAALWLEMVADADNATPRIFRGQRDYRWDIVSSLSRHIGASAFPSVARASLGVLASTLTVSFPRSPVPLDAGIEAICQHYQIPTDLIDFTADPQVAVYFACLNAANDDPTMAVVYSYAMSMAAFFGGRMIVSHPFADRIYRQLGLFIDVHECERDYMRRFCTEVRFPADASFRPFKSRRPAALLRRSDIFSPLATAAKRWAWHHDRPPSSDEAERLLTRQLMTVPKQDENRLWQRWYVQMFDLLNRLSFAPGELRPQSIYTAAIGLFARDNPLIARVFYAAVRPTWQQWRSARGDLWLMAFDRAFRGAEHDLPGVIHALR